MNKGLMGLRRYQTGGGIGDPGDDWLERLYRQLLARWASDKFGVYPSEGPPTLLDLGPIQIPSEGFNESDAIDYLIDLSNYEDAFKEEGLSPGPLAVPPLTTPEEDAAYIRRIEAEIADAPEVPPGILENFPSIEELRERAEREGRSPDQLGRSGREILPISSGSSSEAIDDLIGLSNLDIDLGDEGISITPAPSPHAVPPLNDSGWDAVSEDLLTFMRDQPVHDLDEAFRLQSRSPDRSGIGSLLNRLTSGLPKWGSIAAPLLAAAASPAALAAEQAFDFAISPESLGGTASEVPGAGRTWRESPHIDPSDKEVASFMLSLLPYTQHQLARPSTGSQRAIDELIRRAQAGTPVNRYRR